LFEAFAELRHAHPRAGLLVVGPQEVPPEAKEQIRRLGIGSDVRMGGNLSHAEFLTSLQRADIFIRTHLRDGVCASVLEALQLGVPVVASQDGHRPPSVLTYLPGDAADLRRVLSAVLSDMSTARARVRPPNVENQLENEISLLLAVEGGAQA
jgi:glycosyltransferase involved in cell wall biosynthesis